MSESEPKGSFKIVPMDSEALKMAKTLEKVMKEQAYQTCRGTGLIPVPEVSRRPSTKFRFVLDSKRRLRLKYDDCDHFVDEPCNSGCESNSQGSSKS